MNELHQLELKQFNWEKYGTLTPETEFYCVWDEERHTYELINIKELVDVVNDRISEIEAQMLRNRLARENPLISIRIRR